MMEDWNPFCPTENSMRNTAKIDSPLNLYQANGNALLRVLLISGDWRTRRSFNELGIHAGEQVRVLSRAPFGGPLVIEYRGTRVAVGKQLAEKVRVEVLS
jgi:Fe2+ transport system protein FeoA